MTFDQLYIPVDGDETAVWAAMHEYELRQRRYRLARIGLIGVLMETREAIERLTETFRGQMDSVGDRISRTMYGDPDLRP